MQPRRTIVALVLVALTATSAAPLAADQANGSNAAYNFNESHGCGSGVAGVRPPYVGRSGFLPTDQVVYGPWADFFGRNWDQVNGSMRTKSIGSHTIKVHQRMEFAFDQAWSTISGHMAAGGFYPIDQTGGWAWRTVGGRDYLSMHFFGNAVDFNWSRNPLRRDNTLITDMPAWFIDAFKAAGFCWGGDWVNAKDTMHYSWMGPQATTGYGPRPAPYPPLTARAPFDRQVVGTVFVYNTAADQYPGLRRFAAFDRSRDGNADLYALGVVDGRVMVEAAGSRFGFDVVGFRRHTQLTSALGDIVLADLDGDRTADLVVLDRAGGTFSAYTDASDFKAALGPYPLPAATEYTFGHFDDDYTIDLYAITRGAQTTVTVRSGGSGYTQEVAAATPALGDTTDPASSSFAIADLDVDGRDDLYLVRLGTPATVTVATAPDFTVHAPIVTGAAVAPTDTVDFADYDGDGRDDLYVITDGSLGVFLAGQRDPAESLTTWFLPSDPPPWDAGPKCLGPNPCDQVGYVDGTGEWSLRDEVASDMDTVDFVFGNPGDVAFVGDWDCDGDATPGLYRQSDGYVYLRNSNTQGVADLSFFFGNPGDIPLAGDFNGNGCDTVSLYRPSDQSFHIINQLAHGDAGLGAAQASFVFGDPGDKPFTGDFDGNGIDDVGLHREATGLMYYRLSHTTGPADLAFIFGDPGDKVVTGDWDGSGTDTVAVYRPDKGRWFIKLDNSPGVADHAISFEDFYAIQPVAGWFATDSRS